jgi:cellulose synthase/poly-beta-1,6-N-acetylglucosamine synthase-like glycosyltransferase
VERVTPRWSVVVGVPAHDEQALLAGGLRAIVRAARRVAAYADVHIVVAADACTDRTELVAAHALADWPASIVRLDARNVGAARAAAIGAAYDVVGARSPERLWIAMTDADSRVPSDWLQRQLRAAAAGYDAVAGGIVVGDWQDRSGDMAARLSDHRRAQRRRGARPVHGANLGVSAIALRAVGGVPEVALSEDALLVRRMVDKGLSVLWDADLVVRTSARRSSRAPGGFSSLLDELERRGVAAAS